MARVGEQVVPMIWDQHLRSGISQHIPNGDSEENPDQEHEGSRKFDKLHLQAFGQVFTGISTFGQ